MPTYTPPVTPNYLTGQIVAVQVGAKLAYCLSGNADTEAKVVVRTNSRSNGFQEIRFGTKMASGTLNLAYNGDDPPTIAEGTFATLLIDTAGYETEQGQAPSGTTPKGELIAINAGITKVSRSWNADSGDYAWNVTFTSSGAYQITASADQTTTTISTTTS